MINELSRSWMEAEKGILGESAGSICQGKNEIVGEIWQPWDGPMDQYPKRRGSKAIHAWLGQFLKTRVTLRSTHHNGDLVLRPPRTLIFSKR